MKFGITLGLGALAVAAVAVAAMPLQDAAKAKPRDDKPAARGAPDMTAMMAAMTKAGALGEQHKEMAKTVGNWTTNIKSWMDPTQPPTESTGVSWYELALGGRFLIEHHTSEMPGMGPFEGMGILAYNNVSAEWQHVWMDSMGTGMMASTGKAAADGSVTFKGEFDDPMTGEKVACRMIARKLSDTARSFEMYCTQDGKESKSMEIQYSRAQNR